MKKFYVALASVTTVCAVLFSNVFASYLFTHQPETPKCLSK